MEITKRGIPMIDEKILIQEAILGNQDSFVQLLNQVLPKIQSSIQFNFKISYHDAQDIIQIAIFKAWNNIKLFKGNCSFFSWLYVIIKNEALCFIKSNNKIKEHEININSLLNNEEFYDDDLDKVNIISDDFLLQETAIKIIEKREILETYKKLIDKAIRHLSPPYIKIFKMFFTQGKSYKEISKTLNVPIGTVMSRIHYAKKDAQKYLIEYAQKENIDLPL